jgi:5'-methylthioadenosine phosphorylase
MSGWTLGIIGGSGLYEIDGLEGVRRLKVDTPWGDPSDEVVAASLHGVQLRFLPRHGRGHRISPSDINYRANIDALKRTGVTDVLSVSACGSLQEAYAPGDFVMVDQFIDRTFNRQTSFFGAGLVAHVSMADPVCGRLSGLAGDAAASVGARVHRGGTYLAMEGPQFSSRAESVLHHQWGCAVIGMTNMPEAKLAREAELPYATVAMVTDWDSWRPHEAGVDINDILRVMHANGALARAMIPALCERLAGLARTPSPQGIETVLDFALMTAPEARNPTLHAKLDAVAGRVLNTSA